MKIDPHRHLGGSISVECVWDIIQRRNYSYLASTIYDVQIAMTFIDGEQTGFHRFLDKFKILDEIEWDEELIDLSIKSVCDDLEKEGIDFCWLDFSINKYMHLQWHKVDAIKFIHDSFEYHRPGKVGLILSLKYESLQQSQRQYSRLIDDPEVADILMGLDLVGDESYFDAKFYSPIFKEWRNAGKMVRAHVGESQSHKNVEDAILRMKATNIAHGIKSMGHHEILEAALDHDVVFDMAITSNYLTGVWDEPDFHPILDMMGRGLKVTIGSDDPVQCSTTLDKEFEVFKSLAYNLDTHVLCETLQNQAIESTRRHVRI